MSQLTEIRWHARAGQGAVTAAKLVADTALLAGAYIQAMPEYGPERMGAPLKAYTRVSDDPIEVHNNITNPNIVIILDDTLLASVDVCEGLSEDGIILMNTTMSAEKARKALNCADTVRVGVVDASGISLDTIKRDIPNTPIVGALSKTTGLISKDKLEERMIITFGKKFSQEIIDANIASVERAYQEVVVA